MNFSSPTCVRRLVFALILFGCGPRPSALAAARAASNETGKSSCAQLFAQFIDYRLNVRDGYLPITTPLRGEAVRQTFSLDGSPIEVFRELGSGGDSVAYLGLYRSEVVVIKKMKESSPPIVQEREILLSGFLAKKKFNVCPVLGSSRADGLLVKKFIPGAYLEDLERQLKFGKITEAQLAEAKRKLAETQHELNLFQSNGEFKAWAKAHGLPAFIDRHESNFLYQDGEWVLIDP